MTKKSNLHFQNVQKKLLKLLVSDSGPLPFVHNIETLQWTFGKSFQQCNVLEPVVQVFVNPFERGNVHEPAISTGKLYQTKMEMAGIMLS